MFPEKLHTALFFFFLQKENTLFSRLSLCSIPLKKIQIKVGVDIKNRMRTNGKFIFVAYVLLAYNTDK